MDQVIDTTLANLSYEQHHTRWTSTLITGYLLIFAVGTIGNTTVIAVISRNPWMKTVTNLLILNLAVANLLLDLICAPLTLLRYLYPDVWLLAILFCKVVPFVHGVFICISTYLLVAISADRMWPFFGSVGNRHGFSVTCAKRIIALAWIIGVVFSFPLLSSGYAATSEQTHDFDFLHCFNNGHNSIPWTLVFIAAHVLGCFAVPLLVVAGLNGVMCWKMHAEQQVSHRQPVTILGMTKRLWTLGILFFISWAPVYGILTQLPICESAAGCSSENQGDEIPQKYIQAAQLVGYISTCINPLFTVVYSKKFMECLRNMYRRR